MPRLPPSITFWNRLEPRPRSNDLANALAARVRDPAWFLARQWQLGEFRGEDAGSPAYVRVQSTLGAIAGWAPGRDPVATTIRGNMPVERALTSEGASPDDLSLAIELGQTFDRLLDTADATDLRDAFLSAYPIRAATRAEEAGATRLRSLAARRTIDGVALYLASRRPPQPGQPPPGVPASVPDILWSTASTVVDQLAAWVASTIGTIEASDPPAWQPAQLDYAARVFATQPTTSNFGVVSLSASPDGDGNVAWHALDIDHAPVTGLIAGRPFSVTRAVIPAPVRFPGMPNERFWDFEDGRVDFGGLRPDRRSLASLVLMDFMLVHGNDWFIVPFDMRAGTLAQSALTVVDVFGERTPIARADANDPRWTIFSIANPDGTPAPYFALPQSCASVVHDGAPIEEVRFLRDDTANLAWGVERVTEGALGTGWITDPSTPRVPAARVSPWPLAYQIQTSVPHNWFPFQPVRLVGGSNIALEMSALLSLDGPPIVPSPRGRILAPSALDNGPYRVRDTQIPREGTRVLRRVRRARDAAGGTHIWLSRARSVGTGEGSSGLRWDVAISTVPPEE
ncbi:MAG: hypothetical protein ACKV2T_17715 [Kofleriaceae bacterium]